MDKNGKLVMDETIKGTLAVIMLIFIFVAILFGLFGRTKASAEEKLLSADKLKDVLKKFTTTPGKAEFDRQGAQTTEIATVIKETIDKMSDTDCIEKLDFSEIEDKNFIIGFEKEDTGSKLSLYKLYKQEGYIFYYNLLVPVYYFTNKGRLIYNNFKIDKLEMVKFDDTEERIKEGFLYKDESGGIVFFSEGLYNYIKYKQICSDGKYLKDKITSNDLKNFNKIIISYNDIYTEVPERYKKYYPGEYDYIEENNWWKKIDEASRNIQQMLEHINEAMDYKFKVNLYKIQKDKDTTPRG